MALKQHLRNAEQRCQELEQELAAARAQIKQLEREQGGQSYEVLHAELERLRQKSGRLPQSGRRNNV